MKEEKYDTYPEVEAGTTAPGRDVYESQNDVFGDEAGAQVSFYSPFPLRRRPSVLTK